MNADIIIEETVPNRPLQGGSCSFHFGNAEPATGPFRFGVGVRGAPADTMREILLQVDGDGAVYVFGRRAGFDPLLHPALRAWFAAARAHLPENERLPYGSSAFNVVSGDGTPPGHIAFCSPTGSALVLKAGGGAIHNGVDVTDPADVVGHFKDWLVGALASLTGSMPEARV